VSLPGAIDQIQDALKTALDARAATGGAPLNTAQGKDQTGQVPISLGTPVPPQPEHVWIGEESEVTKTPLTSGSLTVATFTAEWRVPVYVYTQVSGDYKAARDRNTVLAADVQAQLDAQVPSAAGLLDGHVESCKRDTGTLTEAREIFTTLVYYCGDYPSA
jgi:hypothetical protein